jgi:hypothetical protein
MFGDNHDIPAFRWYGKDEQKLFVSGKDASLLDARYAKGNGLMRGGLTESNFKAGTPEEKKRRAPTICGSSSITAKPLGTRSCSATFPRARPSTRQRAATTARWVSGGSQ